MAKLKQWPVCPAGDSSLCMVLPRRIKVSASFVAHETAGRHVHSWPWGRRRDKLSGSFPLCFTIQFLHHPLRRSCLRGAGEASLQEPERWLSSWETGCGGQDVSLGTWAHPTPSNSGPSTSSLCITSTGWTWSPAMGWGSLNPSCPPYRTHKMSTHREPENRMGHLQRGG